jgi:hypothetical protein
MEKECRRKEERQEIKYEGHKMEQIGYGINIRNNGPFQLEGTEMLANACGREVIRNGLQQWHIKISYRPT